MNVIAARAFIQKTSLLLIAGLVLTGCSLPGKSTPTPTAKPTPKPKLTQPANIIPVAERPYVQLVPTAAREVTLSLFEVKKQASAVDFELEYASGETQEAAIGSVPLPTSANPSTKKILLGSQSGGGKITYHEKVTGGTLTLSFFGANGAKDGYKLANGWRYFDNKKPQVMFASQDEKFSIETGKVLNTSPYVIVYQSPGLPGKEVSQTVLAGPYAIAGTSSLPMGKATVTLTLSEDKPAVIWAWSGTAWVPLKTTQTGTKVTATGDLAITYIAVASQ